MGINKTIHYCWFGNGEKSELLKHCIASWKQLCPDYEIVEWNETNFDINYCEFTKQAYEAKKYAFVSDVARLWIIYHHGGHYLDTDVELKQSLDVFDGYDGWFASEDIRYIATGLGFGAVKHAPMVKCMLDDYQHLTFNAQICVPMNTAALRAQYPDLGFFGETRTYQNILLLDSVGYNRYAHHYYAATWLDEEQQKKRLQAIETRKKRITFAAIRWIIVSKIRNQKLVTYLDTHKNPFTKLINFMIFDLIDCGLWFYIKYAFNKLFRRKKSPRGSDERQPKEISKENKNI